LIFRFGDKEKENLRSGDELNFILNIGSTQDEYNTIKGLDWSYITYRGEKQEQLEQRLKEKHEQEVLRRASQHSVHEVWNSRISEYPSPPGCDQSGQECNNIYETTT